jgi:hypothetical protein
MVGLQDMPFEIGVLHFVAAKIEELCVSLGGAEEEGNQKAACQLVRHRGPYDLAAHGESEKW